MSQPLTSVAGSTSTSPPVTAASSQWNLRPVEILVGLGVLGLAAVAIKIISDSLPSPSPQPTTKEDPELIKFLSEQHKSGLLSKRKLVCINEAKSLPFEQFAEGIIRFETTDLSLKEDDEFFIRCSEYKSYSKVEPFFTQTATPDEDLEFFIPNLPLKSRIKLDFGTPQREISLSLDIDHARGLYTIFKKKLSFHSRSEPFSPPSIRSPLIVNFSGSFSVPTRPESLENPLFICLSENNLHQITPASAQEKGHLTIKNPGEHCVVYLHLISGKRSIPVDERDIVVPLVISAGKTKALTKKMLEDLWKTSYQWATSKVPPQDNLDLRLYGIQQMIYRNLPSLNKN